MTVARETSLSILLAHISIALLFFSYSFHARLPLYRHRWMCTLPCSVFITPPSLSSAAVSAERLDGIVQLDSFTPFTLASEVPSPEKNGHRPGTKLYLRAKPVNNVASYLSDLAIAHMTSNFPEPCRLLQTRSLLALRERC